MKIFIHTVHFVLILGLFSCAYFFNNSFAAPVILILVSIGLLWGLAIVDRMGEQSPIHTGYLYLKNGRRYYVSVMAEDNIQFSPKPCLKDHSKLMKSLKAYLSTYRGIHLK